MTNGEAFEWIWWGRLAIQTVLPIVLVYLIPIPRKDSYRTIGVVILCWFLSVLYVIYVYNPAGIAMGHEVGTDFPENRFDNNIAGPTLFMGWFYPLLSILLFSLVDSIIQRIRGKNQKEAS